MLHSVSKTPTSSPSSPVLPWGMLHLILLIPAMGPSVEKALAAFPRSLDVSPAPITVWLVNIFLPIMERRHESGLEQWGVKPGLVYPVDVLAELLADL